MNIPQDSLYKVLQDSIFVLNKINQELNSQNTFWHDFHLWDTNVVIVIATVVSLFINYWINIRTTEKNYRYEYYKKIIEKRFNAYNELEKLTIYFKTIANIKDKSYFYTIFSTLDDYNKFKSDLLNIWKYSAWYSPSIIKLILELDTFCNDHFFVTKVKTNSELNEAGSINHQKMFDYGVKLETLIVKDLHQLDKIKEYTSDNLFKKLYNKITNFKNKPKNKI